MSQKRTSLIKTPKVKKIFSKLKAGPLFWLGIKGHHLCKEEKDILSSCEIGAVVLFKRNILSLRQLFELCHEIHQLKPKPLIAIDREGGKVDRLKTLIDYPNWPSPRVLSQICSLEEIKKVAFYQAQELKNLGIALNFAPCMDICSVPSPLLEDRIWGKNSTEINTKTKVFLSAFKKQGLALCAKHFPGHGGVREDSHFTLPKDNRSYEDLKSKDLKTFQKFILSQGEMIMTAHILYPQIDSNNPATLSSVFLKDILRKKMQFKGLIISDDLDMKALKNLNLNEFQIFQKALKNGIEILLKCDPFLNWFDKQKFSNLAVTEKVLKKIKIFKDKYCEIKPLSSFKNLKESLKNKQKNQFLKALHKKTKKQEMR